MADTAAVLEVDVLAGRETVTAVLTRLESQLERSDATAQRLADALEAKLARSQGAARNEALAHAQAEARLQATSGNVTGAIETLSTALEGVDRNSLAAIRAETQLAQLQNKLARETETLARMQRQFAQSQEQVAQSGRSIPGLFQSAGSALGQFGVAFGAGAIAKGTIDLARSGAAAASARESFDNLASAAGQDSAKLLASIKGAANGTISESQLIVSANTGILLAGNKLAKELPQLLQIARASAKATGQDISFVFDSLVRGIARGSPQIIDNSGITLDAAAAFETYAQSIGKSVDQLSDEERQQATLNAVLAAGSDIVQKIGLSADDAATRMAQATAAVDDLKTALGERLAPTVATVAHGLANILKGDAFADASNGANQAQAQIVKLSGSYAEYTTRINAANEQLRSEIGKDDPLFAALVGGLAQLTPAQFAYAQSLIQTGVAQQDAVAKAQALSGESQQLEVAIAAAKTQSDAMGATLSALGGQILQVASAGPQASQEVFGLVESFLSGEVSAEQLAARLAQLRQIETDHAAAAADDASMMALATQAHQDSATAADASSQATQANTQALVDHLTQSQQATQQTAQFSAAQSTLASLGAAVAGGLATAGNAALVLRDQYGIAYAEALKLIQAQATLAHTKAQVQAVQDFRAGERSGGEFRSEADQARVADARRAQARLADEAAAAEERYNRQIGNLGPVRARIQEDLRLARARGDKAAEFDALTKLDQLDDKTTKARGARGKAAGAARLTDAQQLGNKLLSNEERTDQQLEDLDLKHAKRMVEIERDAAKKRLEADAQFHQSRLDGEADFYSALGSVGSSGNAKADAALRQQLSARYEAAAQEADAIAKEKGADAGQAYLEASAQAIQKEGEIQDKINKARQDKNSGEAEYWEGVLRLQQQADQARLDQIKANGSQIASERQQQIDAENAQYDEQAGKIETAAGRAADAQIRNAQRAGKAVADVAAQYDALGQSIDRVSAKSGGPAPSAPAPGAPAPEAGAPTTTGAASDAIVAALESAKGAIVDALGKVERAARDTTSAVRAGRATGGIAG